MKKNLVILASAIQFFLAQPVFAQINITANNQSKPTQTMQQRENKKNIKPSKPEEKRNAAIKEKKDNIVDNYRVYNKKYEKMMFTRMVMTSISIVLQWTLMVSGIIAIWVWIKKRK
jgi:maltodextrin utilization protein YvdJ